jgi:hypothetical protein
MAVRVHLDEAPAIRDLSPFYLDEARSGEKMVTGRATVTLPSRG